MGVAEAVAVGADNVLVALGGAIIVAVGGTGVWLGVGTTCVLVTVGVRVADGMTVRVGASVGAIVAVGGTGVFVAVGGALVAGGLVAVDMGVTLGLGLCVFVTETGVFVGRQRRPPVGHGGMGVLVATAGEVGDWQQSIITVTTGATMVITSAVAPASPGVNTTLLVLTGRCDGAPTIWVSSTSFDAWGALVGDSRATTGWFFAKAIRKAMQRNSAIEKLRFISSSRLGRH